MPFTKEEHKEHREYLKTQGICTSCHKRETENNRSVCYECQEDKLKRRDMYRKDKTRCIDCANTLGEFDLCTGRAMCPRCLENKRISKIRRSR